MTIILIYKHSEIRLFLSNFKFRAEEDFSKFLSKIIKIKDNTMLKQEISLEDYFLNFELFVDVFFLFCFCFCFVLFQQMLYFWYVKWHIIVDEIFHSG